MLGQALLDKPRKPVLVFDNQGFHFIRPWCESGMRAPAAGPLAHPLP
jgi:hypothetical protein